MTAEVAPSESVGGRTAAWSLVICPRGWGTRISLGNSDGEYAHSPSSLNEESSPTRRYSRFLGIPIWPSETAIPLCAQLLQHLRQLKFQILDILFVLLIGDRPRVLLALEIRDLVDDLLFAPHEILAAFLPRQ